MARGGTTAGRGTPSALSTLAAILTASLAVSLTLALQPRLASAEASCPHVKARPHQVSLAKLRRAMTCLVNNKRERHGRRRLDTNARLQLAAQRHDDVMLKEDCFRHDCPGEPGLNKRVRRAGYTDGQEAWRVAEDLGFDNTPRQMIRRLLHSRFNRRNLLKRRFRDIGVGVGWGAPKPGIDDSRFETFTIVLGWRRAK